MCSSLTSSARTSFLASLPPSSAPLLNPFHGDEATTRRPPLAFSLTCLSFLLPSKCVRVRMLDLCVLLLQISHHILLALNPLSAWFEMRERCRRCYRGGGAGAFSSSCRNTRSSHVVPPSHKHHRRRRPRARLHQRLLNLSCVGSHPPIYALRAIVVFVTAYFLLAFTGWLKIRTIIVWLR